MAKKSTPTEYAIVDIETTGGNASGSRITEIAIIIHDGNAIIDRFETLINPEKHIPLPIFALTGIDNELVKDAPIFEDVAEKIFEMLEGRIFVAHNVNFDYSFIRHQLEECGYKWTAKKLCTIRMTRRLRPGLRSYGLGHLCDALDIPMENRHRAGGDADATAILFSRILQWDDSGVIAEMLKRDSGEQQLPPNLPKEYMEALPSGPGVYYFHDRQGKVVYVGKAVNIKKRVTSHFTGHDPNPQRQRFLNTIFSISHESCATELMAFLLECIEIKRHWPPFNRALKRFEPKYGLVMYEDQLGYKRLAVGRLDKFQQCVQVCNKEYEAIRLLRNLVMDFNLDTRLCSFGRMPDEHESDISALENIPMPAPDEHNALIEDALTYLEKSRKSFAIMDKGRQEGEHSCIWVEKGNFHAMGYIAGDTQLSAPEDIRESLTRYRGNHYMMQLIHTYAQKYPRKVKYLGDVMVAEEFSE